MSKFIILMAICLLTSCGNKEEKIDIPIQNEQIVEENIQDNSSIQEENIEENSENNVPTNYDLTNLSNKKISWYFNKGKDHAKPTISKDLKEVADKYGAIYLDESDEKIIYLTFDEGYENGYTGQILDTLKEYNVKATFFITGPYFKKEEELVRRMVEEGHTVGNHTVNHPSMPEVTDNEKLEKELLDLDRQFYDLFGISMKYVRPPKGEFSERTLALSKNLGYTSVFWSFAYKDWETNNQKGTDYAVNTVINGLHPGEVMLLHAVSKDNANALPIIIEKAREMGYEFGEL